MSVRSSFASCFSAQDEILNIIILSREMNVDVLTISSKSTPANAISFFIQDLSFTPLHCQVEVAVIGINAVLHLRPKEYLNGLVIYINGLTVFDHWRLKVYGGGTVCLLHNFELIA
jgi:hypothetical protein